MHDELRSSDSGATCVALSSITLPTPHLRYFGTKLGIRILEFLTKSFVEQTAADHYFQSYYLLCLCFELQDYGTLPAYDIHSMVF
eukprot:c36362_g1_i1 orf=1-252(-)